MTDTYVVTATMLNLRRAPILDPGNITARLGYGEIVQRIGDAIGNWYKVRVSSTEGYVSARYLTPAPNIQAAVPQAAPGAAAIQPPPVHFPTRAESAITSTAARHCPLAGAVISSHQRGQPLAERIANLHAVVRYLSVERSARYLPSLSQTYCNIYSYDYCYLAGVYLPRVWWTSKALLDISIGRAPAVVYGKTVRELTANDLYSWLGEWGDDFGWRACADVDQLQSRVNEGAIGIICAQRAVLSRSGHITIVLPETPERTAQRAAGIVTKPLQSQAGARNKQYFANQWWVDLASQFGATGFWYWP